MRQGTNDTLVWPGAPVILVLDVQTLPCELYKAQCLRVHKGTSRTGWPMAAIDLAPSRLPLHSSLLEARELGRQKQQSLCVSSSTLQLC
jgi:hypothetical protein